jgi:5-methylcytosine-specific restriction protein A
MGKLSAMPPRLAGLAPRLARQTDDHGHSRDLEPWRKWYSTAEWKRLKRDVHIRDLFTCQCGCGTLIQRSTERIADHVRPHRGDRRLFFDPTNVQTLWKPHHDGWKQRQERAARRG